MIEKASNQKLINRIDKLVENHEVSDEINYTVQEKKGIYQCVIDYKKDGKRELFWVSTSLKVEKGNLRNAKNKARDISDIFRDKTKSKKGYRSLPLFPKIKDEVLKKLEKIEENKKIFGDKYNYKYDGYICVQDNGDLIQPNYFTKRFSKIIKKNNLRKITPHGLRHSIATLLHLAGTDIRDLQDWLGYESITSTNRYTRSDFQKQIITGKTVKMMFEKEQNKSNDKTKRYIVKKRILMLQHKYSDLLDFLLDNFNKNTIHGGPREIRTPDPTLRRRVLYPTELLTHNQ